MNTRETLPLSPAASARAAQRRLPAATQALAWWRIPGRLGPMLLGLRGQAVGALLFEDAAPGTLAQLACDADASAPPLVAEVARQVDEYLGGRRRRFEFALEPRGSEFARRVWRELETLGYGERVGYAQLAARLGLGAEHARAVGRAVGANPLLVLVPCHRVLGSDGALRGYAGGVARKRTLLELELEAEPPR